MNKVESSDLIDSVTARVAAMFGVDPVAVKPKVQNAIKILGAVEVAVDAFRAEMDKPDPQPAGGSFSGGEGK